MIGPQHVSRALGQALEAFGRSVVVSLVELDNRQTGVDTQRGGILLSELTSVLLGDSTKELSRFGVTRLIDVDIPQVLEGGQGVEMVPPRACAAAGRARSVAPRARPSLRGRRAARRGSRLRWSERAFRCPGCLRSRPKTVLRPSYPLRPLYRIQPVNRTDSPRPAASRAPTPAAPETAPYRRTTRHRDDPSES